MREKKSNSLKFLTITFTVLMVAGLGASTDLDNIETITPSGTNPINITGEVLLGSTNNLNMNGNSITNYFGSTCSAGNAMVHVNDDGTLDCVDVTGEVQSDFVDRSGDTMTGTLDMNGNAIIGIDWSASDDGAGSGLDADTVDGVQLSNINWGNTALSQTDVGFVDLGESTVDIDMGNKAIDDTVQVRRVSDGTLSLNSRLNSVTLKPNDNAALTARAGGNVIVNRGNLNLTNNAITNVDWASSDNPDTTIADDQTLSTTADVSGTNDQITIANGNSITIDDDYAANTDASTKCGSDQVLEGGNTCVTNYEAGDDGDSSSSNEIQGLSSVVSQDSALGSGETIDTSSGTFRLPVGTDAY